MINFPNAPAQGQTFSPPGGYQYIYLDGVWRVVEASQNLTALSRNRIVNGAFQHGQENGKVGPFGGNDTYTLDQWTSGWGGTGTPNHGPFQDTATADVDWYLRLNSSVASAAVAAGDYFRIRQIVEGIRTSDFKWGTAAARQVVLRFRARSSIIGTFSVAIVLYGGTFSFTKNCTFTAVNTWQDFTVVIPGPTTGTWPTGTAPSAMVILTVKAGSTYLAATDGVWSAGQFLASPGVSNWLSVAGQTFDVANVGLYLDPLNTGVPPRWEMPDEADELIRCKRYYQKLRPPVYENLNAYVAGAITGLPIMFQTTMRIAPAVTLDLAGGSIAGFSSVTFDQASVDGGRFLQISNAAGGNLSVNFAANSAFIANARM